MVAATTRRLSVRLSTDESCPSWAHELFTLSTRTEVPGVPFERVPQQTIDALDALDPGPPAHRRKRIRAEAPRKYKPYVRTFIKAFYLSLLPFAIIVQRGMFADAEQMVSEGDVAVLSARRLADLARKINLSYDRTQQWMALLIALGFVRRYHDGRQVIYVLPLSAYFPSPSPEAIRDKLTEMIGVLSTREEDLHPHNPSQKGHRPEFKQLLLQVKTHFESHYRLAPLWELPPELRDDPEFQTLVRELEAVLPGASRTEVLRRIVPIIAKRFRHLTKLEAVPRHFVARVSRAATIESTLALGNPDHPTVASQASQFAGGIESTLSRQNLPGDTDRGAGTGSPGHSLSPLSSQNGEGDASTRWHERGECATESTLWQQNLPVLAGVVDGQSGFSAQTSHTKTTLNAVQSASTPQLAEPTAQMNLDLVRVAESPTLNRNYPFLSLSNEDKIVNVRAAEGSAMTLEEQAEMLALILEGLEREVPNHPLGPLHPNEKLQKAGCHLKLLRETPQPPRQIVAAALLYTLLQHQQGKIRGAPASYFTRVCQRWTQEFGSYEVACAANKDWGKSRRPQGIPRNVRELMQVYGDCTLEELEIVARRAASATVTPPKRSTAGDGDATHDGRTPGEVQAGEEGDEQLEAGMTYEAARGVVERIPGETPHVRMEQDPVQELADHSFVIRATVRGEPWTIHTIEEWEHYAQGVRGCKQARMLLKGGA